LDDLASAGASVAGLKGGKDDGEENAEFAASLPDFGDGWDGIN
jgi:hypothetical protein